MSTYTPPGLDWQPDLPDSRDFSPAHDIVQKLFKPLRGPSGLPRTRVDLREYFPEVDQQGPLRRSAVLASTALIEYFDRRAFGRVTRRSNAFLYKVARKLLGRQGDSGVNIRSTLKALALFGIPPERYCPDDLERFDQDPDPFLYALGNEYRPLIYVRLDARNAPGSQTLENIKAFLSAGLPCVIGFSVPESLSIDADIPWRPSYDEWIGGHVVTVVGYDDQRLRSTKGALLFRNSWGTEWGEHGYGWLPYRYIEEQLASDCWTLLNKRWLQSDEFARPAIETRTAHSQSTNTATP